MPKKLLSEISIVVAVMVLCTVFIGPSQAQSECHIEPNADELLSQTNERLVFFVDDRIQTPDKVLLTDLDSLQKSSISVAGSRIAWTANNVHTPNDLYIYDVQTKAMTSLDIFDSEWIEPDIIQWISADEVMIIYKTSQLRIPEWYPGSIINVDTGETDYIFPTYADHLFEEAGVSSIPLVETQEYLSLGVPQFSADDRYLMLMNIDRNYIVIDVNNREIVQELENGIWSYDGEFVARFDDDSNAHVMTIYRIADNSIHDQVTIKDIEDRIWISGTSWSPDGNHIAFYETAQQTTHLGLIDLEQKQKVTTCFVAFASRWTIPFQFSWSSDGRYLAFYGVPETLEAPEEGTIYIYDTETDIAYGVYTGDAQIVGWAKTD